MFLFSKKESGGAKWTETRLLHPYYLEVSPWGPLRILQYWLYAFLGTLWIVRTKNIDLVWERSRPFGGAGTQAASILHKKSVFELNEPLLHTYESSHDSMKYRAMAFLLKSASKKASAVVATHPSMVKGLSVERKRVDFTSWGVEPGLFEHEGKADSVRKAHGLVKGKTLLYVGSLRPWHAMRETFEAFARVAIKEPKAKLMVIGAMYDSPQCISLIGEFNLGNRVELIPYVTHEQLPAFIHAADVCLALYNRNFEWFKKLDYFYSPIKVHEYKACGKPIVASDMGNLKELVPDGKGGFLVNEQDAKETANAILRLFNDPVLREKMGAFNQREAREKYAWKALVQKTLLLLDE